MPKKSKRKSKFQTKKELDERLKKKKNEKQRREKISQARTRDKVIPLRAGATATQDKRGNVYVVSDPKRGSYGPAKPNDARRGGRGVGVSSGSKGRQGIPQWSSPNPTNFTGLVDNKTTQNKRDRIDERIERRLDRLTDIVERNLLAGGTGGAVVRVNPARNPNDRRRRGPPPFPQQQQQQPPPPPAPAPAQSPATEDFRERLRRQQEQQEAILNREKIARRRGIQVKKGKPPPAPVSTREPREITSTPIVDLDLPQQFDDDVVELSDKEIKEKLGIDEDEKRSKKLDTNISEVITEIKSPEEKASSLIQRRFREQSKTSEAEKISRSILDDIIRSSVNLSEMSGGQSYQLDRKPVGDFTELYSAVRRQRLEGRPLESLSSSAPILDERDFVSGEIDPSLKEKRRGKPSKQEKEIIKEGEKKAIIKGEEYDRRDDPDYLDFVREREAEKQRKNISSSSGKVYSKTALRYGGASGYDDDVDVIDNPLSLEPDDEVNEYMKRLENERQERIKKELLYIKQQEKIAKKSKTKIRKEKKEKRPKKEEPKNEDLSDME
mgnify:CR=1 FL=1|tara:strand:- start:4290 stop:5948 length:1659 start_codon:yes stop_codon:yes gene_type:complete